MSFQSLYLRLLPIIFPFAAIVTATVALAIRIETLPDLDNIVFVLYFALLSGLIPLCIALGLVFVAVDFLHRSKRHYYIALSFVIMLLILVRAYELGINLDF